jgi:peptide/nickel transport system permease protein
MNKYILRRLVQLLPTLLGISLLVFGLMRLLPGDVVRVLVGPELNISAEQRATLERMLGLDAPLPIQYLRWLGAVLQGDLGVSLRSSQPVLTIIGQRFPITLELSLLALLVSWLVAVPLGVWAAVRRRGVAELTAQVVGLIGLSLPNFWLATMLLLATSLWLRWQPSPLWVSLFDDPITNLQMMIMPVISLSAALVAAIMRMVRSSMLEVLGQDYIRTAQAKGLGGWLILFRHALKNAFIPVVTVMGVQLGLLLGGAVVVEQIYGLPGIGWMILNGIYQRDYTLVQGGVLLVAVVFVLINLLVDVLYAYVDPRIRYT